MNEWKTMERGVAPESLPIVQLVGFLEMDRLGGEGGRSGVVGLAYCATSMPTCSRTYKYAV